MSCACTLAQLKRKELRTMRFAQLLAEMQAKGYSRKYQRKTVRALQTLYHVAPDGVGAAREKLWSCLYRGAEYALKKRYNVHRNFWEQMSCIGIGCSCAAFIVPSPFVGMTLTVSSLLILYQVMRSNHLFLGPKSPKRGYKNKIDRKRIADARTRASAIVTRRYARMERQLLQRQKS